MPSSDLYRYMEYKHVWVKYSCIENIANAANEYSPIKDVDIFNVIFNSREGMCT